MIFLTQQVDWGFWVIFLIPAPFWMAAGWLAKSAWDDAKEHWAREEARRRHPSNYYNNRGETSGGVGQWTERWEWESTDDQ